MLSLSPLPVPPWEIIFHAPRATPAQEGPGQALHCEGMHKDLGTRWPWGTWARGMCPKDLGHAYTGHTTGLGWPQVCHEPPLSAP